MNSETKTDRLRWLALILLLLALSLRVFHLDFQSLWRDEVDAIRFAERPLSQLLDTFSTAGENGPLYFLLLKGWLRLAGRSEFALRYLSAVSGVISVALTVALGNRLLGRRVGYVGGALVASSPYLVWYGQEGKMYALLSGLVLAALWMFWAAATKGGWLRWLLAWLLTTLSIYVHVLAAILVAVEIAWFLLMLWRRRETARLVIPALLMFAMLVLPYLPLLGWQLTLWRSPKFQTGHAFVPLDAMSISLLWGFSRGVLINTSPWVLVPFVFALLAGTLLGGAEQVEERTAVLKHTEAERSISRVRVREWNNWFLLAWIIMPVSALFVISMRKPMYTDRYLIWIAPAFALLLSAGLIAVWQRSKPIGTALSAVILILNLQAVWSQSLRPIKSDFRRAAAYVEPLRREDEPLLFQMPYIKYTYAYYAQDTTPLLEGPFTNSGTSEGDLAVTMRQLTDGFGSLWLISSEAETWDSRGLVQQWLENNGVATDSAEFTRVVVTRFELSTS